MTRIPSLKGFVISASFSALITLLLAGGAAHAGATCTYEAGGRCYVWKNNEGIGTTAAKTVIKGIQATQPKPQKPSPNAGRNGGFAGSGIAVRSRR